jgi:hypothetical protein
MKFTYTPLTNLINESAAVARINDNFSSLQTVVEKLLSRDGTSPNTMTNDLDMNSKRIVNLPAPLNNTEPLRLQDWLSASVGTFPPGSVIASLGYTPANIAGDTFLGATTIPFTQTGTGAVASTVDAKLKGLWKTAEDFNCVGDGSTDDTVNLQKAIDAVSAAGGGVVYCGKKYKIGNITVKWNVILLGDQIGPSNYKAFQDYYALNSQLRQTGTTTITMEQGATICGLLCIRDGLTLITSLLASTTLNNAQCATLLAQFTGIAISATNTTAVNIRDVFCLGHTRAIYLSDSGNNRPGRALIQNVRGDCINGIYLFDGADIATVENCHFWPYLTVEVVAASAGYASPYYNTRWGTAYAIGATNGASTGAKGDASIFQKNFGYGYSYTFFAQDSSEILFANNRSDHPNVNDSSYYTTITGYTWVAGTPNTCVFTQSNSQKYLPGSTVTVAGINPSGANGVFTVLSSTATTFTVAMPVNPGAWVSGGTAAARGSIAFYILGTYSQYTSLVNNWSIGHDNNLYINVGSGAGTDFVRAIGNHFQNPGPSTTAVTLIDGRLIAAFNHIDDANVAFDLGSGSSGATLYGNEFNNCTTKYQVSTTVAPNTYINGWTPWISYATVLSSVAGTFTSASATMKYRKSVDDLEFIATVGVPTNGTAASGVKLTVPTAASTAGHCGSGRKDGVGGQICQVSVSGTDLTILDYNNAHPSVDGVTITVHGSFPITGDITLV